MEVPITPVPRKAILIVQLQGSVQHDAGRASG
jgi:hypothetical protein